MVSGSMRTPTSARLCGTREIALVLSDELGHEAVRFHDPTFTKTTGDTKVLTSRTAGHARVFGAGFAHSHGHKIATLEGTNRLPHLDHFAERFMSDHQELVSLSRHADLKGRDFTVGPTDAHFPHTDQHVASALEDWGWNVDDPKLPAIGKHCHRAHQSPALSRSRDGAFDMPRDASGWVCRLRAREHDGLMIVTRGRHGGPCVTTTHASGFGFVAAD
jgi:hypothetical protein